MLRAISFRRRRRSKWSVSGEQQLRRRACLFTRSSVGRARESVALSLGGQLHAASSGGVFSVWRGCRAFKKAQCERQPALLSARPRALASAARCIAGWRRATRMRFRGEGVHYAVGMPGCNPSRRAASCRRSVTVDDASLRSRLTVRAIKLNSPSLGAAHISTPPASSPFAPLRGVHPGVTAPVYATGRDKDYTRTK